MTTALDIRGRKIGGRAKDWRAGKGWLAQDGYRRHGSRAEHVLMVESVLGKKLPPKAVVHHVNGIRDDNRNSNFVVCPDTKYHRLLHTRQDALDSCGHADWLKCTYCKKYDERSALYRGRHHMACMVAYTKLRRQKMRAAK